jgi:hypothetical protein
MNSHIVVGPKGELALLSTAALSDPNPASFGFGESQPLVDNVIYTMSN